MFDLLDASFILCAPLVSSGECRAVYVQCVTVSNNVCRSTGKFGDVAVCCQSPSAVGVQRYRNGAYLGGNGLISGVNNIAVNVAFKRGSFGKVQSKRRVISNENGSCQILCLSVEGGLVVAAIPTIVADRDKNVGGIFVG